MKIAFNTSQTFNQVIGGAEIQLLKTKEALEGLGVEVHFFDQWHMKITDFDLVHNFGGDPSTYPLCSHTKKVKVPLVVSTIYWPFLESYLLSDVTIRQKILGTGYYFFKRILPVMDLQRQIFKMADLLLPNSDTEAQKVSSEFKIKSHKIHVVPNGVNSKFNTATSNLFVEKYGIKDFVLCVGRFEPRKNQLSLIKALKGTGIPLVFIGEPPYQPHAYYEACIKESDENVYFLGNINHEDPLLMSAYAACDTFILPSWYDTPGLVALEAGLAGAKVIVTNRGSTRDYFSSHVTYVNPRSVDSIKNAVLSVYGKRKSNELKTYLAKNFLWEHVGHKTLQAYRKILG